MALIVRGVSAASSSGSTSTATGTIPAETLDGDLVLALVQVPASSLSPIPPSDWVLLNDLELTSSSQSGSLRGLSYIASPGDGGTPVEIPLNTSTRWALTLITVADDGGVACKIEQIVPLVLTTHAAAITTPAISPFAAPTLLLAVASGSCATSGAQPTVTAAAGFTMRTQATSTAASLRNSVCVLATKPLTGTTEEPSAQHPLSTDSVAASSASIIISSTNAPPVADAGPDLSVGPGAQVTLDGTLSYDLDGTVVGYAWEQVSGTAVTLSDATTPTPSFTAPADVVGATLVFGLTVTDNQGGVSAQDTVTVTVAPQGAARVRVAGAWETHPIKVRNSDTWV